MEPYTVQAIAATGSAIAALCSLVAATKSLSIAKAAKEQSAEFQRLAAVREVTTKAHMLKAEAGRELALCEDVRRLTLTYGAMIGASSGSAEEEEKSLLENRRKEVEGIRKDAIAMIDRKNVFSQCAHDELIEPLARLDANLNSVQLGAADRIRAVIELTGMIRDEVKRRQGDRG